MPIDLPQTFWDAFREAWRTRLASYPGGTTAAWTELIKASAEDACYVIAAAMARSVVVGREKHGRIDVFARDCNSTTLLIAFESELARWGYNGNRGKDWREEFRKLCKTPAELRVLSSTFEVGTGSTFSGFLRDRLDELKEHFMNGVPGSFCLVFGPDWCSKDPQQEWLAFSIEPDYSLRELFSVRSLRPQLAIDGEEPS